MTQGRIAVGQPFAAFLAKSGHSAGATQGTAGCPESLGNPAKSDNPAFLCKPPIFSGCCTLAAGNSDAVLCKRPNFTPVADLVV